MTKREVEFDDLWTLKENNKGIEREILKIRKLTRSIHIKEIMIDEGILDIIKKNKRVLAKYNL